MGAQACGAGVKKLGETSRDKTAARPKGYLPASQVQAATDKPPEVQPALSSTQAATDKRSLAEDHRDKSSQGQSVGATNGSHFSIAQTLNLSAAVMSTPPPLHPGVPILTGTVPSPPPAAAPILGTATPPPAPARDAQMPPEKVGKPVTLDDLLRPNVVAPPAQEMQPPLYWPPQPQWGGPVQHWPQGYHPEAYGYAAYGHQNGFTEQHATAVSPSLILPPPSSGVASLQATSVAQLPMSYGGGGGDNSPRSVLLTMCGAWGALKAGPASSTGALVESSSAIREDLGNTAAPALPRDALLKYRKVFGAGSSQKPVEVVKAVPVSSSKGGARARKGRAAQGS